MLFHSSNDVYLDCLVSLKGSTALMMLNTKAVSVTVPSRAVTAEKEMSDKHQQTGSVRGERWAAGTAHQIITLIGTKAGSGV